MTHLAGFRRLLPSSSSARKSTAVFILLALAVVATSTRFLDMSADDAFITYRYALNFLQGEGLVFNPGERVLSTTAPLHALVLIPLGALSQRNIPLLANLLSSAMLLIGAWSAYRFLEYLGHQGAGILAALLMILNIWTYSVFPLETILLMGLELAALHFYARQRLGLAAVMVALAITTRYDAALLAIALTFHWLFSLPRPRQTTNSRLLLLLSAGILLSWFAFATTYYGSPLPNTIVAKAGLSGNSGVFLQYAWPKMLRIAFANPSLSAAALMLSVVSVPLIWTDPHRRHLQLLPLWGGLYVVGYTVIRISFPHTWYYYPVMVIEILLGCYALLRLYSLLARELQPRFAKILRAAASLAVVTLLVMQALAVWRNSIGHHASPWTTTREKAYVAVADWLKVNTAPDARVALLEIGTVGYYSGRRIVDLLGLATPAATANARLDWRQNINLLKPDYVIMQNRPGMSPDTPNTQVLTLGDQAYTDYLLIHSLVLEGYTIRIYARDPSRMGQGRPFSSELN